MDSARLGSRRAHKFVRVCLARHLGLAPFQLFWQTGNLHLSATCGRGLQSMSKRSERQLAPQASDEGSTGGTGGAMPSPRNTEKKRRFKAVSEPGAGDGKKSKSAKEAQSIEELFGEECVGALRIERIFEIFGEPKNEYVDIPWFDEDGKPNLIADPLNRPLQLSTVAEYEQRLFASGLADDCAGGLVAQ